MKRAPFSSLCAVLLATSLACPNAFAQGADAPAKPAAAKTKSKKEKKKKKDEPAENAVVPLSDALTGDAKDAYESGKLLYNDGDYQNARLKFERAYELSQDPRLLWNMAAAEKQQRRYDKVLGLIEKYLSEGGDKLSEQDRADARALVDTVRALVAEVTLTVNEPGAEVDVDGEKVGESPLPAPLIVPQGARAFRVSKDGFVPFSSTQSVSGGAKFALAITLKPEVHEGRLRVVAGLGEAIRIDGKEVGKGQWQGTLSSGAHALTVTARGKQTYQTDVVVSDNQLRTERVVLHAEPRPVAPVPVQEQEGTNAWPWVAGGAAAAIGLGVLAYFLFKPADDQQQQQQHLSGTLPPGYTRLSF
jgi:tetratricopeptide (TPR) repeat protein